MLVACQLTSLSALVFDYAVGGAGAQSGGWGCSRSRLVRDSRTRFGFRYWQEARWKPRTASRPTCPHPPTP
jgi:hypothetical protein